MKSLGLTVAVAAAQFALIEASPPKLQLPKATASVDVAADGWTPKPTPPPPGGLTKLRKRQTSARNGDKEDEGDDEGSTVLIAPDNTCGYIDGRAGAHFTCGTDYYCALFPASSVNTGYVGCCDDVECGVRFDCIDYEGYYSSSLCDNGCQVDAYTQKCIESDRPYCNTISFSGDIYDYWCNSLDISTAQAATTAFAGQDRSLSTLELTDESTTLSLTGDVSDGGPGATADPSATQTGSAGDEDDNDNSNNGNKDDGSGSDDDSDGSKDGGKDGDDDDGTPVGPIVGGVVGGVAALGIGGLALWLFFRNKKKKQAAAAAQPSPSVAYAPVQQQGSPHPPPGYYDPKFVATGQQYQPLHQQQQPQQQPGGGGFYAMGNTPPPQPTPSPGMSYADPNRASTLSASYPSGFTAHSPTAQQPGFIAEAPSRPEETHRGGVHEMG